MKYIRMDLWAAKNDFLFISFPDCYAWTLYGWTLSILCRTSSINFSPFIICFTRGDLDLWMCRLTCISNIKRRCPKIDLRVTSQLSLQQAIITYIWKWIVTQRGFLRRGEKQCTCVIYHYKEKNEWKEKCQKRCMWPLSVPYLEESESRNKGVDYQWARVCFSSGYLTYRVIKQK